MTDQTHIRARKFLQEFFNDDELTVFCFDYFPQVYNEFTTGMPKTQKVLMLISYSQRRERFKELLAALERERPSVYQQRFGTKPGLIAQEPQVQNPIQRNPRKIFISHAGQDGELAQQLAVDLRNNGWQTWIAPDNIRPGEKWVEAIDRGLMESGVFVLLLTPEAATSRWVQTEMNAAIGMENRGEVRLFTLNVKPTAISALWGAYQWIGFDRDYDVGLTAFLSELEPRDTSPPVQTRAPNLVLPETKEQTAAPATPDAHLPENAATPPPAITIRHNSLQTVADRVKTMPRPVLFGSGGVIVLLLLALALWPDADNPSVELTEVAEAIIADTEEPEEEEESIQPTESATATEEPATATSTMSPSPTATETVSATPTTSQTPISTPSATPTLDSKVPPADARLGASWVRPSDDMAMVFVPSGSFLMGSSEAEFEVAFAECVADIENDDDCHGYLDDELPQHSVALDSFWLDRTEVTNEQFSIFLNSQGNQTEGGVTWLDLEDSDVLIEMSGSSFAPKAGFANHPVQNVSWYGAAAYCESVGGSLPTEAQWEYAARGEDSRIYPWGNMFDGTIVNYCDINCVEDKADSAYNDGYAFTAPVGSYSPAGDSWVEAVDMAGNVREWVADWHDANYYADAPTNNPIGPAMGEKRVVRGGGLNGPSWRVRSANRSNEFPDGRTDRLGFRCVLLPG